MKCPIDGNELIITDRAGVEIDYCPKCRGVWLDRGELDKIIDRSAEQMAPPPQKARRAEPVRHEDDGRYRKKKRRSFLDDLFDFD
ncbi:MULTISPECIES: zf-TFIIB domain-containing protein [unclassified Mameliella]|uniref:TFIIB-type zinc ribbon-containing protein n=1 Tax=unclassified Mameliella TaxID=2630630 RepID=UPI00273DF510|nr:MULTISPECIES: zf-TFIIB domain-containing protein [unclassified Mameliella]